MFSLSLLISAYAVILTTNTLYAVFFLILVFFNAAALLIMLRVEFIALILIIVYVGAVAVLFLFVVMMLDINKLTYDDTYILIKTFKNSQTQYLNYLLLKKILGLFSLFIFCILLFSATPILECDLQLILNEFSLTSNIHSLGQILYNEHFLPFIITGLILFVTMIGAIVLTLTPRDQVKHQDISRQIHRNFLNAVLKN
jgi:NADH-quinone oxidoreductase subunit J